MALSFIINARTRSSRVNKFSAIVTGPTVAIGGTCLGPCDSSYAGLCRHGH